MAGTVQPTPLHRGEKRKIPEVSWFDAAADHKIDFARPWSGCDVVFCLDEGKKVFANRHVLRMSSQVLDFQLHQVLCSMQEIPLPSTSADDMAVLMQAIHPPMTPVTDANVYTLVHWAFRFRMAGLMSRCQSHLLTLAPSLKHLSLAETYKMARLQRVCIEHAKTRLLSALKEDAWFDKISSVSLCAILQHKVEELEPRRESTKVCLKSVKDLLEQRKGDADEEVCENGSASEHVCGTRRSCSICLSVNCHFVKTAVLKMTKRDFSYD